MAISIIWAGKADAAQDTSFFNTTGGNVAATSAQAASDLYSWQLDTGSGTALANRSGVLGTSRRVQFQFRSSGIGGSLGPATPSILRFLTSGLAIVVSLAITNGTTKKLQLFYGSSNSTGSTALVNNHWHDIVIAYTVSAVNSYTFKVYLDGNLEITATPGTNLASTAIDTLQFVCTDTTVDLGTEWFDSPIVDAGGSADGYTGCSGRKCTPKRPNANGGTNSFDTTVSTSNSGYGTGNSIYVNERPSLTTGERQQAGSGTAQENFQLEDIATGDTDLTAKTIFGYMAWVRGSGVATDTIWSNGSASVPSPVFSGVLGVRWVTTTSGTYPISTSCIGMGRPTGNATDAILAECGIVFVYNDVDPHPLVARLTQMGRENLEQQTPDARLTQMGRFTLEQQTPTARLTQMARQVLYPFTCVPISPPCVLPAGCVIILSGGTGGGSACKTNISGGSGGGSACRANMTRDVCDD